MALPISGTIFGTLRPGITLPVGDSTAQGLWEAEEPIDQSVFFNMQTQSLAVWNTETGVSSIYPFGGVDSVFNADAPGSGYTWVIADLIGATVKGAQRGGIGIRLVTGSPAGGEFSFDTSTGTVTINSSDIFDGEWWAFLVTGIPVGAGV